MAELVTVASFTNVNDAHLAKLRLDMAEIESVLIDAETVNMDWFLGRAIGMVKLQVHEDDAARAEEALSSKGAGEEDASGEERPR